MDRKTLSTLFLIVILGIALRFSFLIYNPPSLNWDEVSQGYNAYSILKTGMDQWGQKFPVFNFRAYGDYPTTLNLYLTIPSILIFGLTEFAIRFPHALLGVFTVISIYFFAYGLTKRKEVGLFSAFLAATGPWYIFTSRFVLQSNLSVFLLAAAGAFFFNREKNKYFLPVSFLLLTLSLFSYHTTRIFSPLLLLGGLLIYRPKKILIGIFAFLFFVLAGFILQNPESRARSGVLFLIDQGAVNKIIEARNKSDLPEIVKKIIYNRPFYFVQNFSKNYISYFSPQFLFLKGGTQYQFSIPNFGLIYPVSLPFFYLGIIFLAAKLKADKNYLFISLWLIFSPIPASLTNESYAVIRATTMLPITEILISLGFFWSIQKLSVKFRGAAILIYIIILALFSENYLTNYFTGYRTNYSWSWQFGYKEAVEFVKSNYAKYDNIIVTKKYGEPHEFFLFFLKYNPSGYQSDPNKIAFFQSGWWWVDRFDKFWFVNEWQVKDLVTESKSKIDCAVSKCLLVGSPDNAPYGFKKIKTINFLDGKPAFEIYDNLP